MQTPHPNAAFPAIAVVGAGAVGSYYGALLALAGHRVTLIGRLPHVQAVQQLGLRLCRDGRVDTVALAASTEMAAVRGAGLVLVCVKSGDTDAVARELAPWLAPQALVLSLQNGVQNVATLARQLRQPVVTGVVYAATALAEPGVVQHFGGGDLVIGLAAQGAARDTAADTALDAARQAPLQALAALFARAGVAVRVSPDAMAELWAKLVVNCACNAVSALAQASYGQMAALPEVRELQRAAVREAVAVGRADGQALSLDALLAAVDRIAETMPAQRSSTAQDLARGRRSEIDHLNAYVVRRGAELGIATPVNQALWALVKLAEAARAGS